MPKPVTNTLAEILDNVRVKSAAMEGDKLLLNISNRKWRNRNIRVFVKDGQLSAEIEVQIPKKREYDVDTASVAV